MKMKIIMTLLFIAGVVVCNLNSHYPNNSKTAKVFITSTDDDPLKPSLPPPPPTRVPGGNGSNG